MPSEKAKKYLRLIPNTLTVGRLVLTIALLGMILYAPRVEDLSLWMDWAFVLFVYTGLTDAIDGKLARMFEVTSKFGRIMDPLVDKILICGTFLAFAIIGKPVMFPETLGMWMRVLHWAVAGIIIFREVFVTWIRQRIEAKGLKFGANVWGKIKMFVQAFGVGTVLIKMGHVPDATWAYWFAAVTFTVMVFATVMSGILYLTRKEARQVVLHQT